jgi:hypothetical protein
VVFSAIRGERGVFDSDVLGTGTDDGGCLGSGEQGQAHQRPVVLDSGRALVVPARLQAPAKAACGRRSSAPASRARLQRRRRGLRQRRSAPSRRGQGRHAPLHALAVASPRAVPGGVQPVRPRKASESYRPPNI